MMTYLPARRRGYGALAPFFPYPAMAIDRFFSGLRDWLPAERMTPREDGGMDLRLDLPGFTPDEISVELTGQQVRVSANRDRDGEQRQVSQIYSLGREIDGDAVKATYEAGVLSLSLPAKGEAVRHIAIEGGVGIKDITPQASAPAEGEPAGDAS